MNVNQIYSILNDINHQMWGADAIDVVDLQGLISMGKNIVGDGTQTDKFINKLVDRIGKTIIRTLDLELDFPNLYMDSYNFGCILQKITISPIDAVENSSWNIGDDNFTPTLLDIHKFDCFVTYFTDTDTWSFRATIPDDQMLATAFTNETTMGAFFTGVMSSMTDSVTRAVNNMSRTAINNFIAEKIKADNGVINLLTGYNTLVGAGNTITADEALYNKDFLRYAVNEIRQYIKYLSQESVLYNVGDGSGGDVLRATARDNMHVLALTRWVASVEANLESETFHNDLVSMPLYTEVPYWQSNKGSSSVNDFATNSSIKVIPSSEKGKTKPSDVEQSGIICVLADRQAIAVGLNKRKTATFYNTIDSYTNIKEEATMQYINDLSENGIVFVVADSENP